MKPTEHDGEQQGPQFDAFSEFAFETYQALLEDRTILFTGDVKENIIEKVVLPLTTLSQKNNKPIKLLIHSPGGDVDAGQAAVDAILTSPAPVIGVAMGMAMSAAFDILLSCDKRIVYPNTVLMCHTGSTMMERQTLPQINIEAKLHEQLIERWAKFYASRTKVSEKEWLETLETGLNRYFFPDESLKLGLVHEIIKIPKKNLSNISKFKF